MKKFVKVTSFFALLLLHPYVEGVNYYINTITGSDTNSGTTSETPFAALNRVSEVDLQPGDTIFLVKGLIYRGSLELKNIAGTALYPIIIQYNLSANNDGGFIEVLGNNFNCAEPHISVITEFYKIRRWYTN